MRYHLAANLNGAQGDVMKKAELEAQASMLPVHRSVNWSTFEIPDRVTAREIPWMMFARQELIDDPDLRDAVLEYVLTVPSASSNSWINYPEPTWLSATYQYLQLRRDNS